MTDVAHRFGGSLVELDDGCSWGPGVRFGTGSVSFQEMSQLKALLNGRRYFRQIWKGSIAIHEIGHLVCEAHQHVWSRMRPATFQKFVGDITSKHIKHKLSRRERQTRKRRFCTTIAEHALNARAQNCFGILCFAHVCAQPAKGMFTCML